MPAKLKQFRVFVASPGDVQSERNALTSIIDKINKEDGPRSSYRLELVRWETHAAPGAGRTQAVINQDIGDYDIFVGLMWRRFGTPTGVADSGTAEEFQIAYRRWEENPTRPLMFYFCQKPFMPSRLEELDQMRKVLEFREELQRKALIWDYAGPEAFPAEIQKHLRKRVEGLLKPADLKARPDEASLEALRSLWERMTPEVQNAFLIAYNEKRFAGDGGIDTWTFFAALFQARDKQLDRLITSIRNVSNEALPQRIDGLTLAEPYLLQERPWLSGCVSSAIRRLSQQLPPGRELTGVDIFVDIAKHGTGDSVRLLRKHKIGPEEIKSLIRQNNLDVVVTRKE
jgi:hypothetical protein